MKMYVSSNYKSDIWMEVSLLKRGRPAPDEIKRVASVHLPCKYVGQLGVDPEKITDIKSLFPYIPTTYHAYYNQLKPCRKRKLKLINNDCNVALDDDVSEAEDEDV